MQKKNLIKLAEKVVVDDSLLSFIATFLASLHDTEVVATICSWLSNGHQGEGWFAIRVCDVEHECGHLLEALNKRTQAGDDACFFSVLTNNNYRNLLDKLNACNGSLYDAFLLQGGGCSKYAHDNLVRLLSCGTGLPTMNNDCTFFRFNLLLYWLTYRLKAPKWKDLDTSNFLLPCNDMVFENAYKLGVIKKRMQSKLSNAVQLTKIARKWFGDKDFFKMYELLKCYDA